ncbi:unnamed protein product [Effrenium voratum]|nr:unnamed protein product [Effrenium voratum]
MHHLAEEPSAPKKMHADFLCAPGTQEQPSFFSSVQSALAPLAEAVWGSRATCVTTTVDTASQAPAKLSCKAPSFLPPAPLPWLDSLEDGHATLSREGCLLLDKAIPREKCEALAALVDLVLDDALKEVEEAPDAASRSILTKKYFRKLVHKTKQDRIELTLPMEPQVREVLDCIGQLLSGMLEPFLTREALLVDLSCMITEANAEPQPLHADTKIIDSGLLPLFTVFVALQDITKMMGPTWLCPRTHNAESHLRLMAFQAVQKSGFVGPSLVHQFGGMPADCETGSVICMNSQLLHCGGGQASAEEGGQRRRLLYVTFYRPGNTPAEHSLRDELVGQYRLGDFDGLPPPNCEPDAEYDSLFVAANRRELEAMLQFAIFLRRRADRGAVMWFKRAKGKGHPLASMHLAEIYLQGELGVFKDPIQAEHFRQEGLRLYEALKARAASSEAESKEEPKDEELARPSAAG